MMSWNTDEKLSGANETQSLNEKHLKLALSPIDSSSAVPATGSLSMNLAKNNLSEEVSWEVKLDMSNMTTDTRQSGLCQANQGAVDSGNVTEEHLGKRSLKRNIELVDSSPCQEIIQNKKYCTDVKHRNQIRDCYTNQNTGLTIETQNLQLSAHKSQPSDSEDKENMIRAFTDKQQTPEKSPIPMIAKNLMCLLDEDCHKNNKDYFNSSFLCSDDDRASKTVYINSDSSIVEVSVMESSLEKQSIDTDKSFRESSFEESHMEDLTVSLSCQENTLPKGDENLAVQEDSTQNTLAVPTEALRTLTSKRNAVAFRTYNSHTSASNNSEPSKMSTNSFDAMDISFAYSGSYPMAVTPTRKGKSRIPCQVCYKQ